VFASPPHVYKSPPLSSYQLPLLQNCSALSKRVVIMSLSQFMKSVNEMTWVSGLLESLSHSHHIPHSGFGQWC